MSGIGRTALAPRHLCRLRPFALLVVRDAVSRISPIETIEELRQLLFDSPDDIAVEINADISITATNVVELYRSPWQGPIAWSSATTPIANASAWSG